MSFRLRLTVLVAAAVAVSAIAAAAVMYVMVQGQLLQAFDDTLTDTADSAQLLGPRTDTRYPSRSGTLLLSGRPDIFAQIVDASGAVVSADGEPAPVLVSSEVREVASGQRTSAFADVTAENTHWRIYAVPLGPGRALELARPLTEIDAALANTRFALIGLALAAAVLGAALAAIVARTALRPVAKLTATVEDVTRTRDLSRRVAAKGGDELSRLGTSFDAMLGQLETSLRSQRQLVADASHELRTPLTSLRTNIEVLASERQLPAGERERLLTDVVEQLSEMTTLISGLIDLARGEQQTVEPEEVRLDLVAADAVERARRDRPAVTFTTDLRESMVQGIPATIERAVANLLDNAAKWSPPNADVEVAVRDGQISVRDHGPGIDEEDLPYIFDRFYRSRSARGRPGSGLGLAIVRQVADAHAGEVVAEQAEGGGTRMTLRLNGSS